MCVAHTLLRPPTITSHNILSPTSLSLDAADRRLGDELLTYIRKSITQQEQTVQLLQQCIQLNEGVVGHLEGYLASDPPEEDRGGRERIRQVTAAARGEAGDGE